MKIYIVNYGTYHGQDYNIAFVCATRELAEQKMAEVAPNSYNSEGYAGATDWFIEEYEVLE